MDNRKIVCVSEHSVDLSLITHDSKVLDLGFRYGNFTQGMFEYVNSVCCVDADSSIIAPPSDLGYNFLNAAIGTVSGRKPFIKFGNGTGNFIHDAEPLPRECTMEFVDVFTLDEISEYFGVIWWDLIKFDVEGSEAEILHDLQEPVADQITVEFHNHTAKRKDAKYMQEIFDNMSKWYDVAVCDYSRKHGLGINWWDVLFVLR